MHQQSLGPPQSRGPRGARHVVLSNADQLIAHVRAAIRNRLPSSRRWYIYDSTLDFDFDLSRIRIFSPTDMIGDPDPRWLELVIFGESDYAEGGGASTYLTIDPASGRVFNLDMEINDPLSL